MTWASHETIVDNLPNAVPNSASAAAEEYLSILQDMVVKMRLKEEQAAVSHFSFLLSAGTDSSVAVLHAVLHAVSADLVPLGSSAYL